MRSLVTSVTPELSFGATVKWSVPAFMSTGRFAHATIRALDRLANKTLARTSGPEHQRTGRRGEEDAYFHLRRRGYVIVARNFRSPRRRGEIDLIGWDKDVLCFVEVKTRTTRDVKPAEAAVDRSKQRELVGVAREYLHPLPPSCQWRFDVVSVYYENQSSQPAFELFQNAFPVS
jgi:putative endonuclease